MDPHLVDLELRTLYQSVYGIYNHANKGRPLAVVARHPSEDSSTFSPLYARISEYMDLKIFEQTGIPLDRLLDMPSEYVRYILKSAKREIQIKGKKITEVERQIQRDADALGNMK